MIDVLRKRNPELTFFSVTDSEFEPFGKALSGYDVSPICDAAEAIAMPPEGVSYEPSVEGFERLAIKESLQNEGFGEMPVQIGLCQGHNSVMNALEWHKSSEINIAVTDLALLLGEIKDIKENDHYSAARVKPFYVPKGTVVEIYATTLHYCPCQTGKGGFKCVVVLPKGTNTPLEKAHSDRLLFAKNKWIICHRRHETLLGRGIFGGIYGDNHEILTGD